MKVAHEYINNSVSMWKKEWGTIKKVKKQKDDIYILQYLNTDSMKNRN